jgi:hypothetical protein
MSPALRHVMRAPPWWDEARTPVAFIVSPLAVPLVIAWLLRSSLGDVFSTVAMVVGMFMAYVGGFALGLPIYRYLQAREAMTFWLAPIIGFTIGVIMTYVVYLIVGLPFPGAILADDSAVRDAYRLGGIPGAIVGVLIWLIGRPDRSKR